MTEAEMTYHEIVDLLCAAGVPEPLEDAALLLEHFCGVPRHRLLRGDCEDYSSFELEGAVRRRIAREPLQYIIGKWFFFGLEFSLNEECLIPRPDTELTVEIAIRELPRNAVFLDVGTGSGAISVALLHERPDLCGIGLDISRGALSAAAANAAANGVSERLTLLECDVLAGTDPFDDLPTFDGIISNPPYIPTRDLPGLEPELESEPRRALDGGEDGMIFYRAITGAATPHLKDGGFLLYEIGQNEESAVAAIGAENGFCCRQFRDLSGIVRSLLLRRK